MAKSIPSGATPRMLKWAREKTGLSVAQVASSDKIPAKKLTAWETGDGSPSFSQLRKLAKRYKRPTHVFYLDQPPTDFTVVSDFRRLDPKSSPDFSLELRYALQIAQERQAWAAAYLEDNGSPAISLVGSVSMKVKPEIVGSALRKSLGVSIQDQADCGTPFEALSLWREACESQGIFVFQSSRVPVHEMRGCALPDRHAPAVLLNGRDSPTARIFTLIHEVAHILLNKAALDGSLDDDFVMSPTEAIEKFCNHVSAETLVPREDFISRIPPDWQLRDDSVIKAASARYRVSRAVIGLRLVETGLADENYLRKKWRYLQSPPTPDTAGGPPQHILALARTGAGFARLALSAFHSGSIHGGVLAQLIGMKLNFLPNLEGKLYPNRAQFFA